MSATITITEVLSLLTDVIERIGLTMTAQPETDDESMWTNVIDGEVDAILAESGWTREGALDAIREFGLNAVTQFSGLVELLQRAV